MSAVRRTLKKHGATTLASAAGACLLWLLCTGAAGATTLNVPLTDAAGAPARDAAVYAEPIGARKTATAPKGAIIDQVKKEFVPRVSVIQAGSSVSFPNKDDIRHQVYSFSPAKTFELKLYHGVPSHAVVFDKPGLVILGCNIHDKMVAYVLVVDTPYFAKVDGQGRAHFEGLAPGEYEIRAWQPQSGGASFTGTQRVQLSDGGPAAVKLELKPAPVAAR